MHTEELIDEMTDAMPIRWGCVPPGVRIGGDSFIDVAITVDAAAVWAEFEDGPPPEPGVGKTNGLRNASLRFSVPSHANVKPLSRLKGTNDQWALPDLSWTDQVHVAFRMSLQPDQLPAEDLFIPLARVQLTADAITDDGTDTSTVVCSQALGLPLLADVEWRETPADLEAAALIGRLNGRPALVVGAVSGYDVPDPC